MRKPNGPIKQTGDIHPPELDDGTDEFEAPSQPESTATYAPPRAKPSLMPLLGLVAGIFVLHRLMR